MDDTSLPDPALPASLAHFGALVGDPVRAAILLHLSDGSRRPAGELATLAGVSPQAASAHLAQLVDGGLLRVERQGRHRFFALASGEMAEILEGLGNALGQSRRSVAHPPHLRDARLCYDHLAGRLGVAVFDRMTALGFFAFDQGGPSLGEAGAAWCRRIGLTFARPSGSRRPLLRPCLDWTERRPHMGGLFGAALTAHLRDAGLLVPGAGRRSLLLTGRGARFLRAELGLQVPSAGDASGS